MHEATHRDHAEALLKRLKQFAPADAIVILTKLAALALHAATPNYPGAMDKSLEVFGTELMRELAEITRSKMQ